MLWKDMSRLSVSRKTLGSFPDYKNTSWAKSIRSYDAVPTVYQDYFVPFLNTGREFPYTVLTPNYEGFIRRTTEKLICDFGVAIHVLERNSNSYKASRYPVDGISCVEVKTILLDSSIKICGVTEEGSPSSSTLRRYSA
jgi:hypothetical protein